MGFCSGGGVGRGGKQCAYVVYSEVLTDGGSCVGKGNKWELLKDVVAAMNRKHERFKIWEFSLLGWLSQRTGVEPPPSAPQVPSDHQYRAAYSSYFPFPV